MASVQLAGGVCQSQSTDSKEVRRLVSQDRFLTERARLMAPSILSRPIAQATTTENLGKMKCPCLEYGLDYDVMVTSDRRWMYDLFERRQICWNHLKRDFEAHTNSETKTAVKLGRERGDLTVDARCFRSGKLLLARFHTENQKFLCHKAMGGLYGGHRANETDEQMSHSLPSKLVFSKENTMFKTLLSTAVAMCGLLMTGTAFSQDFNAMNAEFNARLNAQMQAGVNNIVQTNMNDPHVQQMYQVYLQQGGQLNFQSYCFRYAETGGFNPQATNNMINQSWAIHRRDQANYSQYRTNRGG